MRDNGVLTNGQRQYEAPYRKLRFPDFNDNETKGRHNA